MKRKLILKNKRDSEKRKIARKKKLQNVNRKTLDAS